MKNLFLFGENTGLDDKEEIKTLLGSKGANLSEMVNLGLPVPMGFTISSTVCNSYYYNNQILDTLSNDVKNAISEVEKISGKVFGSTKSPLLLSVRSGSKVSMPGMMDTVLNLGINDGIADALSKETSEDFAYDCYARFLEMFSTVVLGLNKSVFDSEKQKVSTRTKNELIPCYKKILKSYSIDIPEDPYDQLNLAIKAVISSWNSQRAKIYRKLNHISDDLGTAVTVQSMVYGNYDQNSATGVLFTRNPVNGVNKVYGEYLISAQGEDIVSGTRTPISITCDKNSLNKVMPESYNQLTKHATFLENYYKDMQDIEFTIESGKLYILQTRSGKRTATSSVKIAYDMVNEGLISKSEAILRIDPTKIDTLLHPTISKKKNYKSIAKGLAASPGAATGKVVFNSEAAEYYSKTKDVILLRHDTCPEDIKGMSVSKAIITSRGGLTSHAAVVARGMGKPCICGINDMFIDESKNAAIINSIVINELDEITIDGSSGDIYIGNLDVVPATASDEFKTILEWADEIRSINIRANAENMHDLESALSFGADGIGLCRTEHMFFDEEKISLVRQMIISHSYDARAKIIEKILPLHKNDFFDLLLSLAGKPINIRLIDPPLHEFLPKEDSEIENIAKELDIEKEFALHLIERLSETNPMLGHRGSRLGVTHPDIYEMQVRAIIDAAIDVKKVGIAVNIEIMLPLISNEKELIYLKNLVTTTAQEVMIDKKETIEYKIGTMIELPRAVIIADKIARNLDYFSFGTNDLTQTVYGISRDDISNFMPEYKSLGIFENDPFQTIDEEGVGSMVTEAIKKGKSTNKFITFGICGEHGGDPKSIEFFCNIGMDYVSCSPYRIPAAKIAAAQAKIRSSC
jgi:pyruvate,orthophosphate dikinase